MDEEKSIFFITLSLHNEICKEYETYLKAIPYSLVTLEHNLKPYVLKRYKKKYLFGWNFRCYLLLLFSESKKEDYEEKWFSYWIYIQLG